MHDVAASFRHNSTQDRHAQQRQVADDVQNLVTHELVTKSQASLIQHPVRRKDDGIIERAAAYKVGASQSFNFIGKAKRSRRGDLLAEGAVIQVHGKLLNADHRMGKIDQAIDLIVIAGFNADAPVTLLERNFFAHKQRTPREWLTDDARLLNHFSENF